MGANNQVMERSASATDQLDQELPAAILSIKIPVKIIDS